MIVILWPNPQCVEIFVVFHDYNVLFMSIRFPYFIYMKHTATWKKKNKGLKFNFYFIVDNFCVHNLLVEDGRCADILNTFCVKNGVNFLCFL